VQLARLGFQFVAVFEQPLVPIAEAPAAHLRTPFQCFADVSDLTIGARDGVVVSR
jgi:hypothetical protein